MKLLSRLFRNAPAPAPMVQVPVVDDESVRIAAIRNLPDGQDLRSLAGLLPGADGAVRAVPALERAAQARLAELIDTADIDFSELCTQTEKRSEMLAVVVLCKDGRRLAEVLASIDDPHYLATLVVQSPSSRVRQCAAETVHDPALLRQLLKQVRNKDKSVYKILKHKLDALNALEQAALAIERETTACCALLEQHSQRSYDALYESVFQQLHAQWHSLGSPPSTATERRALEAIARCREVIAFHGQEIARQAAIDADRQAAQQAAEEARERERRAAQDAALALANAEALARQEAAMQQEAEERARAQQRAAEGEFLRRIGGLIRKSNEALSVGNTQMAAGLRRALEEKLAGAPAMPPHVTRRLQQLDDKLKDLKQWKDYAVAPKRIELIQEMEALIGSAEEPKALADRIKALQQEWRTICKGIVSDAPSEWERFQQASQAAYQPCRDYFAAQAKLRQENLESRRAVLERLTAFETAQNWENPDWRLVASVLREAPQEWRRYFPVDREPGRAAQADFDASMGRLQARIGAWHERNVADKQSLIQRARQLLSVEDSREAIDVVKQLQSRWKEIGSAPRDQDQSLWNEFREVCDAVYQKRQQAHAEYTAGLEADKAKAIALCEEAERVAALSDTSLIEGAAKMSEWRTAYDALDELPRADARGLHDRFERALARCKDQVAHERLRQVEQSVANLFEACRHLRAYEWAVASAAPEAERDALKQAAETFIASAERWPRGALQAVKESLAKAGTASAADTKSRERLLRTLCIRCEILGEMTTPAEDEALRREYQVQRLMQGMGQGSHAIAGDGNAMLLEWVGIGALAPRLHESLQGRFKRCWAHLPTAEPRPSAAWEGSNAGGQMQRRRERAQ